VLQRQLDGNSIEMYQAMIALDNLGERIFPSGSASASNMNLNRELARNYLTR
jgi:hypothetical protein